MVKTLPTPPQNEGTIRTKKDMKEEKKRACRSMGQSLDPKPISVMIL